MLILEGHTAAVHALAFSPDGQWLASADRPGAVRLWDPGGGVAGEFAGDRFTALGFAPDGRLVAAGNGVTVFDPARQPPTAPLVAPAATPQPVAVALTVLDAATVAVGYGNRVKPEPGTLMLRDLATGTPRKPSFTEPHGVRAVAAHSPSKTVAWSNGSRRISLWDVTRAAPVHLSLTHSSPSLAFRPDGKELAAAVDWTAQVFDPRERLPKLTLKGHKAQVTSVAYTPDGGAVVSGSWDGTVRVWDAASGAVRQTFQWPTGKVFAVACSPDGTRFAAAGEKGTVVVWDAE